MSTPLEDPLYRIFEEHLHSGLYDDLPVELFIRDVVTFYWTVLHRNGHVPHGLIDALQTDLIQDVKEMLHAKTYGHYGIADYNRKRRRKSS